MTWPKRADLEAVPSLGRVKASFGQGTVRAFGEQWFYLPDEGEPIIRIGGAYEASTVLPAGLQKRYESGQMTLGAA